MTVKCSLASLGLIAVAGGFCPAAAEVNHAPPPGTSRASLTASVPAPVAGTIMHPGYAMAVARKAYIWGWPMVNMMNRSAALTSAAEAGRLNGVLPVAPLGRIAMLSGYINPAQKLVACPSHDVVQGLGFFALDKEPVVAQVPDFGSRFWSYALYDARTDQFGKLGKQYDTKPGFYLIAGPDWKGETPAGIAGVIRSSTALAAGMPRVYMDDTPEDREAIQPVIDQIVFYPLSEYDGKMKTVDWSTLPSVSGPKPPIRGMGEARWVVPAKFFDQLGEVLRTVPPLPGEEALYGQFRVILDAASRNPQIKRALMAAATETERQVIAPFARWKHNGRPAGNGWNRSANNAHFGTDYFNRTGTARSNMFDSPAEETQYFYTDNDSKGEPLHGTNAYEITFAAGELPPVYGFWSLSLYDEHHYFHPNRLSRYALGTRDASLKFNPDGSLTLYAGARSPGRDRETNWLPAPDGPFSLYIRAYWGKEAILDGSWKPPVVRRVRVQSARTR
jgi:hypothetical protein